MPISAICSICLDNLFFLKDSDFVAALKTCGHVFHSSCLQKWFEKQPICPQCRVHCQESDTMRIFLDAEEDAVDVATIPQPPNQTEPNSTSFDWIQWPMDANQLPENMIGAGNNAIGVDVFVARVEHDENILPGLFCPQVGCAFVSFNGAEVVKESCELLVGPSNLFSWVEATGSEIPPNALPAGKNDQDEVLFVGRNKVDEEGTMYRVGRVDPTNEVGFFPHEGEELIFTEYEILCFK